MKIKHLLFAGLLLFSVHAISFAGPGPKFRVPVSNNRVADPGLKSAGVANLVLVTSTNAALATDNNGDAITDGFVYYVILGSSDTLPADSLYLELRSTGTANLTSARLIPRIHAMETVTAKRNVGQMITFDPPVPFSNGLSVNLGPATAVDGVVNQVLEFGVGVRWKKQ